MEVREEGVDRLKLKRRTDEEIGLALPGHNVSREAPASSDRRLQARELTVVPTAITRPPACPRRVDLCRRRLADSSPHSRCITCSSSVGAAIGRNVPRPTWSVIAESSTPRCRDVLQQVLGEMQSGRRCGDRARHPGEHGLIVRHVARRPSARRECTAATARDPRRASSYFRRLVRLGMREPLAFGERLDQPQFLARPAFGVDELSPRRPASFAHAILQRSFQ